MKQRKKRKLLWIIPILMILAVYFTLENTWIETSHLTVESDRIPGSFQDYTIVQVSDLHNALFGKENERLLKKIEQARPDAIFITGDLVDASRTNLQIALDFAWRATELAPTYYVTGNHEAAIQEYSRLEKGLLEAGVTILNNRATTIHQKGEMIQLVGLADPSCSTLKLKTTQQKFSHYLEEIAPDPKPYTIVLSHRPEVFPFYAETGLDLFFTGHAHGGQIRLPFIGGLYVPNQGFLPKYTAGIYEKDGTKMIVSRGLGNSTFPLRIGNHPELVVVTLKHTES